MINTKRLIEFARKWQMMAAVKRRRITTNKCNSSAPSETSSSIAVRKGHLFVYTIDRNRFMIPLEYLTDNIFRELFRMSEEEFGLPSNRPITLPCNAACMEYIISLFRNRASKDIKKALLTSITSSRCNAGSSLFAQGQNQQHLILYGF